MNKYSIIDTLSREIKLEMENETKTFLFEGIQIPMIQRDYAQGREQEYEIRNRFLKAIFDSLVSESVLELDFVYGSIKEIDRKNYFTPIDGQQRLTTLFLLEYYIANKELDGMGYSNKIDILKKFSYATRPGAKDFCEKLCNTNLSFKELPSAQISNSAWFQNRFKNDPTIKSMLIMLDAIHEKYNSYKAVHQFESIYNKLSDLKFYILPLDGFNLSDELYIKMNARGMQLTDFENLKADLIKWMKEPNNSIFHENVEYNGRNMPRYLAFSEKMDVKWTNFIWEFSKRNEPDKKDKNSILVKLVDPMFLRLINRYFLNKLIAVNKFDNKALDKTEQYNYLYAEKGYKNFDSHASLLQKDQTLLISFDVFIESIINNWESITSCISPTWMNQGSWFFLNKDITQYERIVLFAISNYLEKYNYDELSFRRWMRVVWNIVENTDITDANAMIGAMKLINELSANASNILSFLAGDNKLTSDSSKNAISEERQKAKFILANEDWEEIFILAESHPFFRGSIGFIIEEEMAISEFKNRFALASLVFDKSGIANKYREDGHLFLRAIISRYTSSADFIGQNFIDVDDSEHYLKKMLASNSVVKSAIIEWFNLTSEDDLLKRLNQEVSKDSSMSGWYHDNEFEKTRIRRAHHALYKDPDFMDWLQKEKAIRFSWSNGHLYISRPRSWYTWIMLETNRNEAVTYLLSKGFETSHQINLNKDGKSVWLNYYWCNSLIRLSWSINGKPVKLTLYNNDKLKLEVEFGDQWNEVFSLDFVNTELNFEINESDFIINGHNISDKIHALINVDENLLVQSNAS